MEQPQAERAVMLVVLIVLAAVRFRGGGVTPNPARFGFRVLLSRFRASGSAPHRFQCQ